MTVSINFTDIRIKRIIFAWNSYNSARCRIDNGDWSHRCIEPFRCLESFIVNACEREAELIWKEGAELEKERDENE